MGDLTSFYNLNPTELSAGVIVFNLILAFILQMAIVYIYKKTRHGLSHSQSFIFTLIIIGTLGASIMMAVQNNIIGAFAIFGAFTLIRFRSILKETSDLAFVFFSLVTGIAVGMNHYSLALLTVVILSVIIYLFHRFGFGVMSDNFDYLLMFVAKDSFKLNSIEPFLDERAKFRELLSVKQHGMDNNEYALSLKLHTPSDATKILDFMRGNGSVSRVEILTGKNTSEF